jgi:hypothetical protein
MVHAEAEALAVFKLMRSGVFEQIHYSPDWKGAVLFVNAPTRELALETLSNLPMVKALCIDFELYALAPFDHYQRLFKEEHRANL